MRMHQTAASVGLPLDPDFSCVQIIDDDTVRITATIDAFPKTKEERSLSQSALHTALVDDFSDLNDVDVWVFIPPVANEVPTNTGINVVLASQKIRAWSGGVHDIAVKAALQFAESSYNCTVDTYPWVEADAMRARIPAAIHKTLTHMSCGTTDPLLTHHNVDYVLPPLESVLSDEETSIVHSDVIRVLGGTPSSILQFYEVIYICGTRRLAVSHTTDAVFHRLFRSGGGF